MLETDQKKVWAARARTYDNLNWVSDANLHGKMVECGDFKPYQVVLDAGTGTGVVASIVAPYVKHVYGIDQSQAMLKIASSKLHASGSIHLGVGDIRSIAFPKETFNCVISRNVFHNILELHDRVREADECLRVLKPGGRFILSEGVPPHESLKHDFHAIFALKEIRVVFTADDLVTLVKGSGASRVEVNYAVSRNFSLTNWLDNDGTLEESVKQEIINLHLDASNEFKKHYNLRLQQDNVLIDVVSAFVVGVK